MDKQQAVKVLNKVNARTRTAEIRKAIFALTGVAVSAETARFFRATATETNNVRAGYGLVRAGWLGTDYIEIGTATGVARQRRGFRLVRYSTETANRRAARAGWLAWDKNGVAYVPERRIRIPARLFQLGYTVRADLFGGSPYGAGEFVHAVRADGRVYGGDGFVVAAATVYAYGVPVLWDVAAFNADGELITVFNYVSTPGVVEQLRATQPDARRWVNAARGLPFGKLARTLDYAARVVAPGYGTLCVGGAFETLTVWPEALDTARADGVAVGNVPVAVQRVDAETWAVVNATYPNVPVAWYLQFPTWITGLNAGAGGNAWTWDWYTCSPVVAAWYLRAVEPDARRWRVEK